MKGYANQNNGSIKRCAFCKYWYDPNNSEIEPTVGNGMWAYERSARRRCLKTSNATVVATHSCHRFESKL